MGSQASDHCRTGNGRRVATASSHSFTRGPDTARIRAFLFCFYRSLARSHVAIAPHAARSLGARRTFFKNLVARPHRYWPVVKSCRNVWMGCCMQRAIRFTSGVPRHHRQRAPWERHDGMCTGSPPMCSESTRRPQAGRSRLDTAEVNFLVQPEVSRDSSSGRALR